MPKLINRPDYCEGATMYYVIESNYVGPNQSQDHYIDADTVEIRTAPARANSSDEVCIHGWCGTTNDWATYAQGMFETIEAAEAAIRERYGDVRDRDANGDLFEPDPYAEDVVRIYKCGKYEPMGLEFTGNWCYPGFAEDINAYTTDARLAELVDEYEALANDEGYTLNPCAIFDMEAYREGLLDEVPRYSPDSPFVTPPECQGQIVTLSYSSESFVQLGGDYGNDWDKRVIIEQTFDANDGSMRYDAYEDGDPNGEFDPWNRAPKLGAHLHRCEVE